MLARVHGSLFRPSGLLLSPLLLALACSGAPTAAPTAAQPTAPPPPTCGAELRGKVQSLLAVGRLDRTIRLIDKANSACPETANETWAVQVATLAELGRYAEARQLATQIESDAHAGAEAKAAAREARARCDRLDKVVAATPDAKAAMLRLTTEAAVLVGANAPDATSLRAVKASLLAAWEQAHPDGEALAWAGLATRKLGDKAEAQRLFDRALLELTRAQVSEVRVEVPDAFGDRVEHIASTADGRWIALAYGSSISIFDRTWREKSRIRTKGSFLRLAFAPDGETLATGSDEGIVKLWDPATGKEISTLPQHGLFVSALAYSPDGATLAWSPGNNVYLWDVASGKERTKTERDSTAVYSIAFSLDSKSLAVGSGGVTFWDTTSGALLRKVEPPPFYPKALAFSPDGKTLFIGADYDVHSLDLKKGKAFRRIARMEMPSTLSYSPDGTMLVAGGSQETMLLGAGGKLLRTLENPQNGTWYFGTTTTFFPDSTTLVTTCPKTVGVNTMEFVPFMRGGVCLWDPATGKLTRRIEGTASAPSRGGDTQIAYLRGDTRTLGKRGSDVPFASFATHTTKAGEDFVAISGTEACAALAYPVCRIGALSFPFELCAERVIVRDLGNDINAHLTPQDYLTEPEDAPPIVDCQSSRVPQGTRPVIVPLPTSPVVAPPPTPPVVAPPPTPPVVTPPPTPPVVAPPPIAAPPLPDLLAAQQVACDRGSPRECVKLGEALYNGVGVSQDGARAAGLFRKACDAGEVTGCVDLGWAFASGTGVTKDGAAAAALFGKACNTTTALGCLGLGVLVRDGTGVPKDLGRATALFKQACDGGVAAACKVLKEQK